MFWGGWRSRCAVVTHHRLRSTCANPDGEAGGGGGRGGVSEACVPRRPQTESLQRQRFLLITVVRGQCIEHSHERIRQLTSNRPQV